MTNRKEQLINLIMAKITKLQTQDLKKVRDFVIVFEETKQIAQEVQELAEMNKKLVTFKNDYDIEVEVLLFDGEEKYFTDISWEIIENGK